MTELERRIDVIQQLKEFHPGILQDINHKIAHYTGGMKDFGGLRWDYCIFKATVRELEETLGEAIGGNRQKELEEQRDRNSFDRTLAKLGGPSDRGNTMESRAAAKRNDRAKVNDYLYIMGGKYEY